MDHAADLVDLLAELEADTFEILDFADGSVDMTGTSSSSCSATSSSSSSCSCWSTSSS
jgi:hypothetical protein